MEEFESLVAEAFGKIPEKFRARLKNVALLVEDEPSDEVRREEGLGEHETLLGYYRGIPATARGDFYGVGPTLPDSIVIFRLPCMEEAQDRNIPLADVVRDTVFHEVGHYLGMNEREVRLWEKNKSGK